MTRLEAVSEAKIENNYLKNVNVFFNPSIGNVIDWYSSCYKEKKKAVIVVKAKHLKIYKALFPTLLILDDSDDNHRLRIQDYLSSNGQIEKKKSILSEKESFLLSEYALGSTIKEIGKMLNMSERSTRRLKDKLLSKLDLDCSRQLIAYSIILDLLNEKCDL